jgi:hypothetical protein
MKEVEESQHGGRNNYKRQKRALEEATEETKKEYIMNVCDENMNLKKGTLLFNVDKDKGTKSVLSWDIMQYRVVIP